VARAQAVQHPADNGLLRGGGQGQGCVIIIRCPLIYFDCLRRWSETVWPSSLLVILSPRQFGVPQVGARQDNVHQVGTRQVGTRQVGTRQVGAPQVGASQDGGRQVGPL